MEKLLIITEKPSASRNFAKALGGNDGVFEGDEFVIVHLRGHILAHDVPEKVAYDQYVENVGSFSQIEQLPWHHKYFDFHKKIVPANIKDFATPTIKNIAAYLQDGYIPVVASDIDAMGEGDLLVHEVLEHIGYKGKVYREYHVDETPKSIVKALKEKKDVTSRNDGFVAGTTRMVLDFLTQQVVRAATVSIQNQGYRLPRPVPVGRLQSTIMNLVGTQIDAIENYVPSSTYESRYMLDDVLMLTSDKVERFKTKEEWTPGDLPATSKVKEVKAVPGKTIPPKALTLTSLGKLMSKQGLSAKQTSQVAQKMYDAGVLSYPRTEDNFITPEQFEEMLPKVDTFIQLLEMPVSVFTHREPRKTHVKTGGSHGALRPGANVPKNIADLDTYFGAGATKIYKLVTERFLMMFLEDTEWVRHEYETVDTSYPFKGSIRVITKMGVTDPDEENKDVVTKLPNLSEEAVLYPHEVKSVKPQNPTESWLLGQLEKQKVGTAATQMSIVSRLIGTTTNFPLVRAGKVKDPLTLSPIGFVGYEVAKTISLGTAECTRYFEEQIRKVVKKELGQEELYEQFTDTLKQDIDKVKELSYDLSKRGFQKLAEKVRGVFNGKECSIAKEMLGYTFTNQEIESLFAGNSVTFTGTNMNGESVQKTVRLGNMMYKGKPCVGFIDDDYMYGTWKKEEIRFKKTFMDHTFSEEECNKLLNEEEIQIEVTNKEGNKVNLTGKLEKQKLSTGQTFVGFKGRFPLKEGYVEGVFKGKTVKFKGSFADHMFTKVEIDMLLAGETIEISFKDKSGQDRSVKGKLAKQMYNGNSFYGFKADFGKKKK